MIAKFLRLSPPVEQIRCTALRPRILLLLISAAAFTAVRAPSQALGKTPGARLTVAQKKMVRHFEKRLTTRLNSKLNPGDKDTWYVIVFTDLAMGAKKSRWYSGNTLTTTYGWHAARNSAARTTQGRKNAAMLLLQYYCYTPNTAALRLQPPTNGRTVRARAAATKNWQYRAFAKEEDAKEFFDLINPEKKNKRSY